EEPNGVSYSGPRNQEVQLALSPDGKTVAALGFSGAIKVFDVASGKELAKLPGHRGRETFVRFSPDGKFLVAPAQIVREFGPSLHVWNTETWKRERSAQEHKLHKRDNLAIDPQFWDIGIGRKFEGLNDGKEYQPSIIAASPDGKSLAVGEHFMQGDRRV